jgi:hypothetical protein
VSEGNDPRSAIDAAEQAAAAGDYMAAERYLRDAAAQQEANLGPLHPDLANTLNNLGVVCETVDKPADAERCYRRAYAIAITALEPDHPFVATSEKNLRDFCEARGKPFDLPVALPVEAPPPVPAVAPREAQTPKGSGSGFRPEASKIARGAFALALVGIAALVLARMWFGGGNGVEPAGAPPVPPRTASAPTASPPPAAPAPKRIEKPPVAASAKPRPEPRTAPRAASPRSVALAVVETNLCSDLSSGQWRCRPASRPVDAGQVFFYTRIKSPAATTVEHRWYRGDRLERARTIRVQPNQRSGFRTYSRTAVTPGNWRVELRAADGTVLHTERFAVR